MRKFSPANSRIGVQITEHWFKAVELAGPRTVTNYLVVPRDARDGNSPIQLGERLARLLAENGFGPGLVSTLCEDSDAVHSLHGLPQMSQAEARLYLTRELGRRGTNTRPDMEMQPGFRGIDPPTAEFKRQGFLGASVPRASVDAWLELLESAGVEAGPVLTLPVALLNCLSLLPVWWADTPLVFVYIGQQRSHILLFAGHVLKLVREVRCGLPSGPASGAWTETELEPISERLAREVTASVQYVSRQEGPITLKRLLFSGENDLRPLMQSLGDRLQPTPELFNPADQLDLDALGERGLKFREIQPQMTAVLGTALEGCRVARGGFGAPGASTAFDLTPRDVVVLRQRKLFGPVLLCAIAMISAGLIYFWQSSGQLVQTRDRVLGELRGRLANLAPRLQELDSIEQQRQRDGQLHVLVTRSRAEPSVSAWVLRELSRIIPDEVVIESLSLARTEGRWEASLQGRSRAADPTAAQAAFKSFYDRLMVNPMFMEIEFEPIRLSSEPQRASQQSIPAAEPAKVAFQVRLHVSENLGKQLEIPQQTQ